MFFISSGSYDGNNEDKEYLRAVKVRSRSLIIRLSLQSNYFDLHSLLVLQDAARAKALRAKFEEWEAQVGEDGGYINLVDENGLPLETASKLKNRQDPPQISTGYPGVSLSSSRFENLSVEPEAPTVLPNPRKFQVKRFKVSNYTWQKHPELIRG